MNEDYTIRLAVEADMPDILAFVAHSRGVMRRNGNDAQWGNGYPGCRDIEEDIARGIGHVIEWKDRAVGYFALLLTPEPTYAYIEGHWLDDTTPYGTLHRLCGDAPHGGLARAAFGWGETRCATVRADTHRLNSAMLHVLQSRGYTRCGVVYMEDGSPREAYQRMLYPMVTPSLRRYVGQTVLPQYDTFDAAHRRDHAAVVMAQSMELAGHYPQLNSDMVYAIAAYHDTGLCEGRERHHLVSGQIVRREQRLREWFTPEEIETMAQAVEDHRASAGCEPRSLYGRIVAEADRDIDPETIVRRTVQYGLAHYPEMDCEKQWLRCLGHLREKYGRDGYLRLYIPESRNRRQMERLHALIDDLPRLREMYDRNLKFES